MTEKELAEAIVNLPRNKAPGSDGFVSEFYKVFYGKLKKILLDLYNYVIEVKRLHTSARNGVITLIPKKRPGPSVD